MELLLYFLFSNIIISQSLKASITPNNRSRTMYAIIIDYIDIQEYALQLQNL